MLFDARDDNASGMELMRWIIPPLEGLRRTDEPNFTDKMIAVFGAWMACFQFKSGDREGAEESLRKAKTLAGTFDAAPNYDAERLKFVRGSQWSSAHDALGKTAVEAVEFVLHDKDPELRKIWAEMHGREEPGSFENNHSTDQ